MLLIAAAVSQPAELDAPSIERFARLALDCVHREYPNKIAHVMRSDEDARPPRELTPAFYGCYDWHSSVHGHWLLARLLRMFPDGEFAGDARAALDQTLSPEKIAGEAAYILGEGRKSFERPYGLAWLLQLDAELSGWDDEDARRWGETLAPLVEAALERLSAWLPKLDYPIRVGVHPQTAFSFGLIHDWALARESARLRTLLESRIDVYYATDRECPIDYEPSGHDFLSPCLGEADLMRRVLPPDRFGHWLRGLLPMIPEDGSADWLEPAVVSDPSDPHIGHLDGLNVSRAWMLEGIASGLPKGDPRRTSLDAAAARHRERGLAAVIGEHYEGGHWLGTFAMYLVTQRGLSAPR